MSEAETAEAVDTTEEADAELIALLDAQDETEEVEDPEAEETETEETEDAVEETPDETPEATKEDADEDDPELSKRLDKIQAAEKRKLDALTKKQEEIQQQMEEQKPHMAALEDFNKLKSRVRSNPIEVLRGLGLTDDDLEYVSRQAWYQSPAGRDDPKAKDAVTSERRNRSQETELEETKRQLKELTERIDLREKQTNVESKINEFMGSVEKSIGDASPFVRAKLKNQPEKTRQRLRAVADQMANDDQAWPDAADVVSTLEASIISDLEDLGIDPKKFLTTEEAKSEDTTPEASKKKTAKTLTNDLGTRTRPRKEPVSREDEIAKLLAEDWPQQG